MKQPPVLSLLIAALPLLLAGCVGHREALRANTKLADTSERAATFVQQLQAASGAEVEAHRATRQLLKNVHAEWRQQRVDVARQSLAVAREHAYAEINRAMGEQLLTFQSLRFEAYGSLDQQLAQGMGPLETQIEALRQQALKAGEESGKFPGDLDLRNAMHEADKAYLSAAATNNTFELMKRIEFTRRLQTEEKALVERLQTIAARHREAVRNFHDQALAQLDALSGSELDLGPEPADNQAAFEGLQTYAAAARQTAEANCDYLTSNSWGKDSFFHSAVKSFGAGVLGALPIIGSGKGATLDETKAAGRAVWELTQKNFQQQVADATASAKGAFQETTADARSRLLSAASGFLNRLPGGTQPAQPRPVD